jgi:hypothetical protein
LPGPTSTIRQVRHDSEDRGSANIGADGGDGTSSGSLRKVVLVVFVGGVTYIEISSLRFLSEKHPVDFLVLTTSIISGSTFLESLSSTIPNAIAAAAAVDDTTNSDATSIASSQPPSSVSSTAGSATVIKKSSAPAKSTSTFGFFK